MKKRFLSVVVLVVLIGLSFVSSAEQYQLPMAGDEGQTWFASRIKVPDPLKPWLEWALHGQEAELCPFLNKDDSKKECIWGSPLNLSLDKNGGTFNQEWHVFREGFVPLPGDAQHWPQDVKVGNKQLAVISMDDQPNVLLKNGRYSLTGRFVWNALPESLPLPQQTGILNLVLHGQAVQHPNRDENNVLWLGQEEVSEVEGDNLQIKICRLMIDGIPFQLITNITLDVSGKSREAIVGRALPEEFLPLKIEGVLPARLDLDGRLRVQVRAGHWEIKITARHLGPVNKISLPKQDGDLAPWPNEEIWVFQAQRDFRVASIDGVPSVDPQQTILPEEWKKFPVYRVTKNDVINFIETMRGDADPAPDRIEIFRSLWLDFDGGGYTIRDQMHGELRKSWRLEALPPMELGHVSVDGKDILVTNISGSDKQGVELRQGALNLSSDSRVNGIRFSIPTVGWDHDVQNARATLHLGPGWRLFAVAGADHVPSTWLNHWTLLEIFLVLILSLAFFKLWGIRWGLLAFAGFILLFRENGSPMWVWCFVLALSALLKVIPAGKIRTLLNIGRIVSIIVLIVISISFAVQHLRIAIFPSLESKLSQFSFLQRGGAGPQTIGTGLEKKAMAPSPSMQLQGKMEEIEKEQVKEKVDYYSSDSGLVEGKRAVARGAIPKQQLAQSFQNQLMLNMPGAMVQTGPGRPGWSWHAHEMSWSGPVKPEQRLRIFLIPPWFNTLLAFVRVAILVLLIACILGLPGSFWPMWLKKQSVNKVALILLVLPFLLSSASAQASDIPSQEMLQELADRLTAQPECFPACADISYLKVEANESTLRIKFETSAVTQTAIPLPGVSSLWAPSTVRVDGQEGLTLRMDDGGVWLEIGSGAHQVMVEGSLEDLSRVTIPLPMKPHYVEASVSGWQIEGLGNDGQADENLELHRSIGVTSGKLVEDWSQQLPPFVSIERRIILNLDWRVATKIERLTPTGNAIILSVPLLAGETPTTSGLRVEDNRALISMAPQTTEFSWESTLTPAEELDLISSDTTTWMEIWRLDASPIWHVEFQGIPVVHQRSVEGAWLPEWRPWPSERLKLKISRPAAVPGQTTTIDEGSINVTAGVRSSSVSLKLTVRSSLGGQHEIRLPKDAELQLVYINGTEQPIRSQEGRLVLPLSPGEQKFEITWQQSPGIRTFFKTPEVDLGIPSVNTRISVNVPSARWILFVGGPSLGPAVLLWGIIIILILVAWWLGKSRYTPLKAHQWLLLGLGLTQIPIVAAIVVVCWFLVLEWRRRKPSVRPVFFDALQIILVGWTFIVICVLLASLYNGLLGVPNMQIAGNGSSSSVLQWFADRSLGRLPRAWFVSLPLFYYRIVMLVWALWLAFSFVKWIKWGWGCFIEGERWRRVRTVVKPS